MTVKATRVETIDNSEGGSAVATRHGWVLWQLSEPVPWGYDYDTEKHEGETEYVITSAASVMITGPETYIFPANKSGEVIDWMEMDGSYRGGLDHARAIRNAGWEVA